MIPSAITALMKESVTLRIVAGEDAYGKRTYTTRSCAAYVSYRKQKSYTTSGEERVSTIQVVLAEDMADLTDDCEVTLPNGDTEKIISVERPAWPDGSRHTTVML